MQDVRFGFRMLAKTPGFTLVAILVLALGLGANSAMFTLFDALLLRPLNGRADELVGLFSRDRTKPDSYRRFSYPNYADIRDRNDAFDAVMAHTFAMVGLSAGDTTRQAFADVVSSNYFDTLDVPLAAGRPFTADEERPGARIPVVIVGYQRWKDAGFDPGLIGRTIRINAMDFTVVGVAPRGFTGTMALVAPELWLPLGVYDLVVNDQFKNKRSGLGDRGNDALLVAGRLKRGVNIEAADARLDVLSRQLEAAYRAENDNLMLTVHPLSRVSTSTSPQTDQGPVVAGTFLMGLASVVLLIACLNVANMLLARGSARRKEIAIRLAVGGSRARIVRQLVTEGFLLALAGAAAGLVLAFWATRALAGSLAIVMPLPVQFDARPDTTVIVAATLFAVAATLMFAVGPALRLSRTDLIHDLNEAFATTGVLGRRFSGRNILVVGQIALSLMLLCTGGLFAHGAMNATTADPGFRYDRQLLVTLDPSLAQIDEPRGRQMYRAALERLRALPGVEAVGMASTVPFGDEHEGWTVERIGPPLPDRSSTSSMTFRVIGADYFRALDVPVLRGREFTRSEEDSPRSSRIAVIDEQLASRLFGTDDPIGQSIRLSTDPGETRPGYRDPIQIVGVVPSLREDLLGRKSVAHVYVSSGGEYRSKMHVHVRLARAGAEADVLTAIRRELGAVDSRLPIVRATTMRAFHARSLQLWIIRAGSRMFMTFGALALGLAVVGLYGVRSYAVSRRTREIGIRMAVGARSTDVLLMMLREGAVLSAVGVASGLPLAALLGQLFKPMLYDVKPLDPAVFVAAPAVLALACLVATWLTARRATRVTPLTALR